MDANDIISSALGRLRTDLAGLDLRLDVSPDLPLLWVHGVLIEQALVNLLDNAIRFSPPGAILRVQVHAGAGDVSIVVCDQGPGIPLEERGRVFDMFYTARKGDRGQATGLGLAICRGLLAAHAGSVEVADGMDGSGTCMRISLPAPENESRP